MKIYLSSSSGESIITDATPEFFEEFAANMRAADVAEIWTSHRIRPLAALHDLYNRSDLFLVVRHKNIPVAVFGTMPLGLTGASPWMLSTNGILDIQHTFAKHSRTVVQAMLQQHKYLVNYADSRNKVAIAWLQYCGFNIYSEPININGVDFYKFDLQGGG